MKKLTDTKIKKAYYSVLNKVKKGVGIKDAIKQCNICEASFYKQITEKQKLEIRLYKTSFSIGGGAMVY